MISTAKDKTLVFIPGWNVRGEIFANCSAQLARHFKCYFFTPPAGNYSEILKALDLFIKENQLTNIYLLGWSMGGQIALKYAETNPIKGLILLNSAAVFSRDESAKKSFYELCEADLERAVKYFHKLMGDLDLAESLLLKKYFINDKKQALLQLKELHQQDLTQNAAEVRTKTLIIHTEQDQIISADESRLLQQFILNSKLLILPGNSHFPFFHDCDKISASVLEYFG